MPQRILTRNLIARRRKDPQRKKPSTRRKNPLKNKLSTSTVQMSISMSSNTSTSMMSNTNTSMMNTTSTNMMSTASTRAAAAAQVTRIPFIPMSEQFDSLPQRL